MIAEISPVEGVLNLGINITHAFYTKSLSLVHVQTRLFGNHISYHARGNSATDD